MWTLKEILLTHYSAQKASSPVFHCNRLDHQLLYVPLFRDLTCVCFSYVAIDNESVLFLAINWLLFHLFFPNVRNKGMNLHRHAPRHLHRRGRRLHLTIPSDNTASSACIKPLALIDALTMKSLSAWISDLWVSFERNSNFFFRNFISWILFLQKMF